MSRHTCGKGLPIEYWRGGPCAGCQASPPDAQPAAPSAAPTQPEPRTPDEVLAMAVEYYNGRDGVPEPATGFAETLDNAAKRLRELAGERQRAPEGETFATVDSMRASDYELLVEVINEHAAEFIHEDDVAEVAIYCDAIERMAAAIANDRATAPATEDVEALLVDAENDAGYNAGVGRSEVASIIDRLAAALRAEHERARKAEGVLGEASRALRRRAATKRIEGDDWAALECDSCAMVLAQYTATSTTRADNETDG